MTPMQPVKVLQPPTVQNIYLDYQASTPVDSRVESAMKPFYQEIYANPHATTHKHAILAARAVEKARVQIADALNVFPKEIIFTSGATEANNLAILGVSFAREKLRRKVITQTTEHLSVLGPVKELQRRGFETQKVGVHKNGIVDLKKLEQFVDHRTLLVSIMLVNNETGVIQPIEQIADICKRHGAILHCDCAQALGRVAFNFKKIPVDMATLSSHKIYGPKGIGALFVRNKYRARLKPIFFGGGQEGGLRPGTLPVPLCVGFGYAAEIAVSERELHERVATTNVNSIRETMDAAGLNVIYNGCPKNTAPGCLNFSIPGVRAERLIEYWSKLELSTGSACTASKHVSSHVLKAMKIPRNLVESTIRLSVGRNTTEQDIMQIVRLICDLQIEENSVSENNKGV